MAETIISVLGKIVCTVISLFSRKKLSKRSNIRESNMLKMQGKV